MRQVVFNEFNLRTGRSCYLPLVSGLLRAHAETFERLRAAYRFMPFLYHIDRPDPILAQYDAPDVAAFSVSMWNEQLNLRVAAEVKRRWPACLIVFGGPQVPMEPAEYFARYPFIDAAVRGEGEEAFSALLDRHLDSTDFSGIPGVSFRDSKTGDVHTDETTRPFERGLDAYPSPYLEGLYDDLIASQHEGLEFQAIVETNRGCPFLCTFCFWGRGGLTRKYRYHGLDRVRAEIDWCGRNGIRYVFNADSNFGMHDRDQEIAEYIVETKARYGYPDKFRTCFGKNTDDRIFRIGSLFHKHALEKGITLARQSNDPKTLKNIKRANIRMSTYEQLQARFNQEDIPIYTELILGLPGETVETWTRGIDELLDAGLRNQLFVYLAQVYPNTDLADPDYQRTFGIGTTRMALHEIHTTVRPPDTIPEFVDIVTSTASMSQADWRRMLMFSWLTMSLYSMKLGYFVLVYLRDRYGVRSSAILRDLADGQLPSGASMLRAELDGCARLITEMLEHGAGGGVVLPAYEPIYWDIEEAALLRASEDLDRYYAEFHEVIAAWLQAQGIAYDADELAEVVRYQQARMPSPNRSQPAEHRFSRNVPEYFDRRFTPAAVPLRLSPQILRTHPIVYGGDRQRFARETVLWGRKSGTMLVKVGYSSLAD